jgi:hypothetical protein
MIETIQKRITTVDSDQPSFSKWWWIGRHQEDAAAGALEPGHLDHDRQQLGHEQAADDGQHDLVARGHRDGPHRPAQASEPVSPMKILAGGALYQRKPRPAPSSDPQSTTSSPTPGTKWSCR